MTPMTEPAKGHLAMLAFSLLVAGSFALGAIVANDIAPMALNAVRFAIAGVVIGAVAVATGGIPRSTWVAPWRYLILGGLFAIYFVLMFEGLKTAPPVSAAAVFTLTPIMSGIAGWFLLRQITTPGMALGLAFGGAGALWVVFRADWAALLGFRIGQGELIYFLGCAAHAIYTPMVARLNRGERPLVFTFGMIIAALLILLVAGAPALMATDWAGLGWVVWATIFYVAICASSMTFVLLQYATLRLPSAKVMAYTYLTPSWVILWEVCLGNGAPPAAVLLGIALTAVALLVLLKTG